MKCLCGLLLTRGCSQKLVIAVGEIMCCLFEYDAMYSGKNTPHYMVSSQKAVFFTVTAIIISNFAYYCSIADFFLFSEMLI